MGVFLSREEDVDFEKRLEENKTPILNTSQTMSDPYRLGKVGDTSIYGSIKVEVPSIAGQPERKSLGPDSERPEYKVFSTTSFTDGPNLIEFGNDLNLSSGTSRTGIGYQRSLGQGATGMVFGDAICNSEGPHAYMGGLGVSKIVGNTTLAGGGKAAFDQNMNLQAAGGFVLAEHNFKQSTIRVRGEHNFYGQPHSSLAAGVSFRV